MLDSILRALRRTKNEAEVFNTARAVRIYKTALFRAGKFEKCPYVHLSEYKKLDSVLSDRFCSNRWKSFVVAMHVPVEHPGVFEGYCGERRPPGMAMSLCLEIFWALGSAQNAILSNNSSENQDRL